LERKRIEYKMEKYMGTIVTCVLRKLTNLPPFMAVDSHIFMAVNANIFTNLI
jgi:hypothetical protein